MTAYQIYRRSYWSGAKIWSERPLLESGEFTSQPVKPKTFATEAEARFVADGFDSTQQFLYEVRPCDQ